MYNVSTYLLVNSNVMGGDARGVTVCKLSSQIAPPRNTHRGARCQNPEQLVNTREVLGGTKPMKNDVRMNMWGNASGSDSRRKPFNTAGAQARKGDDPVLAITLRFAEPVDGTERATLSCAARHASTAQSNWARARRRLSRVRTPTKNPNKAHAR